MLLLQSVSTLYQYGSNAGERREHVRVHSSKRGQLTSTDLCMVMIRLNRKYILTTQSIILSILSWKPRFIFTKSCTFFCRLLPVFTGIFWYTIKPKIIIFSCIGLQDSQYAQWQNVGQPQRSTQGFSGFQSLTNYLVDLLFFVCRYGLNKQFQVLNQPSHSSLEKRISNEVTR